MEVNEIHPPSGRDQFLKGMSFLKGVGQGKDEGMAAASFLDSSDLNYPDGIFATSLIYFCGVGVSRNTQTAAEYAQQYLNNFGNQKHSKNCNEIISESMGTQNALKILHALDKAYTSTESNVASVNQNLPIAEIRSASNNKKMLLILLGASLVTLAIGGFFLLPKAGGGLSLPVSKEPSALFSANEIQEAKRKALERAGVVRTDARTEVLNESNKGK
jgi:hypothetical protein